MRRSWIRGIVLAIVLGVAVMPYLGEPAGVAAGGQHAVTAASDGTVWSWGLNGHGQLGDGTTTQRRVPTAVPGLTGIVAVAAGAYHTLALTSDGAVWAWGNNSAGQLGNGTTTSSTSPVLVSGPSGVVAIAAGDAHSVAVGATGTVWTWGDNANGQLGDGTTTRSLWALTVPGVSASAVAAGPSSTIVVRTDGTVAGWGANGYAQLGDGSTTTRLSPVTMTGVTGATAVAAGATHTLVLLTAGTVRGVGYNHVGQLGDGTTTWRMTSVAVSGLTGVTRIAAGQYHSAAITSDGALRTWGSNGNGRLGDGTTTNRSTPTLVPGLSNLVGVECGDGFTLAYESTGVVWTWGANGSGQLGDGTTTERLSPIAISEAAFAWKTATPAFSPIPGSYTAAQTVTVTTVMSGTDIHYTLTGAEPTLMDPALVSGGTVSVSQSATLKARAWHALRPPSNIASGTYTLTVSTPTLSPSGGTYTSPRTVTMTCATTGATIRYTTDGSAPSEGSAAYTAPVTIGTSTTVKAAAFKAGWTASPAASATYTMNFGTLQPPTVAPAAGAVESSVTVTATSIPGATIRYTTDGSTPTTTSPIYLVPVTLTQSATFTARAWHPDYVTSASTAATYTITVAAPTFTPTAGTYPAGQPVSIATATPSATITYTTNGLDPTSSDPTVASGGTVVVGQYTLKARAWKTGCTPSAISSATYGVTGASASASLAAGGQHALGLRGDGVLWTWGSNGSGQVGDGTTTTRLSPIAVQGLTGIVGADAGDAHTAAVRADATVAAWGSNSAGQLGDGTTTFRTRPVTVPGLSAVVSLAAGYNHTLALLTDGTVRAWGGNYYGQLGDTTTTQRTSPVAVSGLTGVVAVAAGQSFSLALKADGTVWAWGHNGSGQVGDGTTTTRLAPVRVGTLTGVVAVEAGTTFGLAVDATGHLWSWGANGSGQLGDGTTTGRLSPVAVSALDGVTGVAAGGNHALALRSDGQVWAWGANDSGQLGDGTTTARVVAAPVPGLSAIADLAAGPSASFALGTDGTVWAWGFNTQGQLGDGTTVTRLVPVATSGPGLAWRVATPVLSPSGGLFTSPFSVTVTCTDAGAVLHYTVTGATPTEGDPTIASGGTVAIAGTLTLAVRGWKLGQPSSVVTTGSYVLQTLTPSITPSTGTYAAAQTVTLSTATPGAEIRYTLDGREPTLTSTLYQAPFSVDRTLTVRAATFKSGWTTGPSASASYWISAGTVDAPTFAPPAGAYTSSPFVSLASTTPDAVIRYTTDGSEPSPSSPRYRYPFELDATTTVKAKAFVAGATPSATSTALYSVDAAGAVATPALVPGGGRFATRQTVTVTGPAGATLRYTTDGTDPDETDATIASGGTILADRSLVLKVRAFDGTHVPSAVRRADVVITGALAAAQMHTLALAADGTVWAWGRNDTGQVGDGTTTNRLTPTAVLTGAVAIAAGHYHSLAVKGDGTVWIWGKDGGTIRTTPAQVAGVTNARSVAGGADHSLALLADGTVRAWGANDRGQLGDGTTTARTTPIQVVGLAGVRAIAAGDRFSMALQTDGGADGLVWSWGDNTYGQLGEGSVQSRVVPGTVAVSASRAIAAGRTWAMAIDASGRLQTWGRNVSGQLGDGTGLDRSLPAPVAPVGRATDLASGFDHGLALDDLGRAWGWGANEAGQAGNGQLGCAYGTACLVPGRATAAGEAVIAAGGLSHTVFVRPSGTVATVGSNLTGQLGDGTTTSSTTAVLASGLRLVLNDWLTGDPDDDGLVTWREYAAGLDPLNPDTNGNGVPDGAEATDGASADDPDLDDDGVPNWVEMTRGTDPYRADSDGDGVADGIDAFPLDPTRSQGLPPDPNDHTPPIIQLLEPTNARRIGGGA